ncbi:MAG: hypothetical protein H7250_01255 [Flavobacterium sp.]|nr:hypothetical protein [Flavobacterium sp.]
MKINKKIKIAILSVLGIIVLFFAILVFHIATAKPVIYENATIQVSRIDFDKPFDSLSTIDITKKIKSIPGVKSEIIVKRNVVVYFHDNKIADSKKVYSQLMAMGNYNAKRFVIPASLASKSVCPVMNKNSFNYKFSLAIQRIFN